MLHDLDAAPVVGEMQAGHLPVGALAVGLEDVQPLAVIVVPVAGVIALALAAATRIAATQAQAQAAIAGVAGLAGAADAQVAEADTHQVAVVRLAVEIDRRDAEPGAEPNAGQQAAGQGDAKAARGERVPRQRRQMHRSPRPPSRPRQRPRLSPKSLFRLRSLCATWRT